MTFEILSSLKSHIIRWPRHLLMAGGLCLLVACGGGGGGGGSGGANATDPTPIIQAVSAGPYYADEPITLRPTFINVPGISSWKITWRNITSGQTGEIGFGNSGDLIQHNPASDTEYTLVVIYQNPKKVTPDLIPAYSTPAPITVIAKPVPATYLAPTTADTAKYLLTNGRNDHTSVRLPNGKVLVCGGNDGTAPLKTCEIFNPSNAGKKWEATGSMSVARQGHTMTLLTNNKVLIAGGWDGKGLAYATAEIYNPSTGKFTATLGPLTTTSGPTMLATRWKHTATLLPDGKVLIAGGVVGLGNSELQETTELYNPATDSFSHHSLTTDLASAGTGLALREARIGHTATLLPDYKILFLGNDGVNTGVAKILTYDPLTPDNSTWETIAAPTSYTQYNRAYHTATLVKDPSAIAGGPPTGNAVIDAAPPANKAIRYITSEILIVGGSTAFDQSKTTERLTIKETITVDSSTPSSPITTTSTTFVWDKVNPLQVNRSNHSAQLLAGGEKVLISGGFDGATALNTIDIYEENTLGVWTPIRNIKLMNEARAQHTSNLVGTNGAVLITGNRSGGITNTSEIWEP
jgi:Galactose oxidase, central domain/Kelch motif